MKLTIVGLPIGNLEDISLRALKTLQEAKYLICEDSRMFNNLWSKLIQLGYAKSFSGKIRFVNDFNEYKVLPKVLQEIGMFDEAVLVSDAGMPLISDPGYKLVRGCLEMGAVIDVVPGPTAESAALALSGLPTDRYLFLGFLPKKEGKRKETLLTVKEICEKAKMTVVVYESSLRIQKILPDIISIIGGDTASCLAVDLTKVSQKVFRGTLFEIEETIKNNKIKGELVLLMSVGE